MFILISASLAAIGFVLPRPEIPIYKLTAEFQAPWFLIVVGMGGLLLTYGFRLIILLQISAINMLGIKRLLNEESIEDSEVEVVLQIDNPTSISIYNLEIRDNYPETTNLVGTGSNHVIVNVPAKSTVKISYSIKTRMIGIHKFGGISFAIRDFLGLFYCSIERKVGDNIKIYPKSYEPITISSIYPGSKTLTGTSYARRKGSGFEFADLREYLPGDELKRIDWKATARIGKLMIKEFDAEGVATIIIIMDASGTMLYGIIGERKVDYAARTVAYLMRYLSRKRDHVGFVLYDGVEDKLVPVLPADHIAPTVFQLLGNIKIEGKFNKRGLANAVNSALFKLGIRENALFIIISDLEGDVGDLPDILLKIRGMRHDVAIISPLTPLFEAPVLKGWEGTIYKVLTADYWHEREKFVRELLSIGVPVINVGPNDFIPAVIERIEEYRRRMVL